MSTHINENILRSFIKRTIGSDKLNIIKAESLGLDKEDIKNANKIDDEDLTIDEIIEDDTLYEEFATMYVQEQEREQEAKDKEQEDREADERRTSGKSNSKA